MKGCNGCNGCNAYRSISVVDFSPIIQYHLRIFNSFSKRNKSFISILSFALNPPFISSLLSSKKHFHTSGLRTQKTTPHIKCPVYALKLILQCWNIKQAAQWSALLPHSKKTLGLNLTSGSGLSVWNNHVCSIPEFSTEYSGYSPNTCSQWCQVHSVCVIPAKHW